MFGRERGALRNIYASGGRGFLHDMLDAAGGANVFADIDRESVQATTELVLARAPDVILEVRSADIDTDADGRTRSPQLGAARVGPGRPQPARDRPHRQGADGPGPRVAEVVERMFQALHPAR